MTARGPAGRSTRCWGYVNHQRERDDKTHQKAQDLRPTPVSHQHHPLSSREWPTAFRNGVSAAQAPYRSPRRKRQGSFISLRLLSLQSPRTALREPLNFSISDRKSQRSVQGCLAPKPFKTVGPANTAFFMPDVRAFFYFSERLARKRFFAVILHEKVLRFSAEGDKIISQNGKTFAMLPIK